MPLGHSDQCQHAKNCNTVSIKQANCKNFICWGEMLSVPLFVNKCDCHLQ